MYGRLSGEVPKETTHPDVPTSPERKVQLMVTDCVQFTTSTFKTLLVEAENEVYTHSSASHTITRDLTNGIDGRQNTKARYRHVVLRPSPRSGCIEVATNGAAVGGRNGVDFRSTGSRVRDVVRAHWSTKQGVSDTLKAGRRRGGGGGKI